MGGTTINRSIDRSVSQSVNQSVLSVCLSVCLSVQKKKMNKKRPKLPQTNKQTNKKASADPEHYGRRPPACARSPPRAGAGVHAARVHPWHRLLARGRQERRFPGPSGETIVGFCAV
mmetsp:Transcript_2956/g.5251  ORF Transcript_2956/g.5251 Transcript_2956/m.5251 type:complete len:117 (+) Transcript_2956:907-1257(+)